MTSATPALALQPLTAFVAASRVRNFDQREAEVAVQQKDALSEVNTRKLWPTFSARGVYAHNQYEAVINTARAGGPNQKVTITPKDQLDAYLNLEVPIIQVARWRSISSADSALLAAKFQTQAVAQDVELSVTQDYYQLVAARVLVQSARRSRETAAANLEVLNKRRAAGLALELDYQRAASELSRAHQILAQAEYQSGQAVRALSLHSGLVPDSLSETDAALLQDDLEEPAPLQRYQKQDGREMPAVAAARLETQAAEQAESAALYTLIPTLNATAQERFTNATGFQGRNALYQLGVTLNWTLDASVASEAKNQAALLRLAQVKHERAQRQQKDDVEDAHALVLSRIIEVQAARSEAASSALAEKIANERYMAGTALQFEALTASREAFQSQVARIQAEANLAMARASLRLVSGGIINESAAPQSALIETSAQTPGVSP